MSSAEAFSEEELLKQAAEERAAGRLEAALEIYRSVLQDSPQNAEAQKALHALQKTIKKSAGNGGGRSNRSKSNRKKKSRALKSGSVAKQVVPQQTALQPDTQMNPPKDEIARLHGLFISGQADEAEAQTKQLTQQFPNSAILFNLFGTILANQGKNDEAIASFIQAVTIKPDYAEVHNNLGRLLFRLGLLEEAGKCFRHAIMAEPDCAQAFVSLGNVLRELGKSAEAVAFYQQGLALDPDNSNAHVSLGVALYRLGKIHEAISSYRKALEIQPDNSLALVNFANAVVALGTAELAQDCRDLIVRCLQSPEVDSNNVSLAAQKMLLPYLLIHLDEGTINGGSLRSLAESAGELLFSYLKNALIIDPRAEKALTRLRKDLLQLADGAQPEAALLGEHADLLEALAFQGFLNEYIWDITDEEEQALNRLESRIAEKVAGGESPDITDLFLIAAYRRPVTVTPIRQWALECADSVHPKLGPLVHQMILNVLEEAEIRETIEQLTTIEDDVSQNVRAQYEENPYPRWDSLSSYSTQVYTRPILTEIIPNAPELPVATENPEVLIAGCGTGKQPIVSALVYKNSNVLAVDLSRTSMAFAIRKARELQVQNIRFAQADIMKLGQLEDRFDVIECGGVLHHMADPAAGFRVLVNLLKPGGYLKIGLYSKLARQHVTHFRDIVAEKGFEPNLDSMRAFRRWVREQDSQESNMIQESRDFYSASMLRDLIFHVQEHQFTLPEIKTLLDESGLEFLGFSFHSPAFKGVYAKTFPDDPACINLENWHKFEEAHNSTFAAMYKFWCRKPS